jgi:4-hydroxybenzoate polyprenyltransferase
MKRVEPTVAHFVLYWIGRPCQSDLPMFAVLSRWASFVKFSHTLFALPFALASMVVAAREHRGWPGWRVFGWILVAMVGARTCAMAFNRIVDRRWDALNPRTAGRHLVTGEISLGSAWLLCGLAAAGLVFAAWMLNPLCFWLSPVALFFVCFYSLTKRFTDFSHVWLGIALAIAPVGAWLAVTGRLEVWSSSGSVTGLAALRQGLAVPGVLALAVVLWLVGFDVIYATQDYEFDRSHGLRSLVVRWGPVNALSVAFLAHLFMWALLVVFGLINGFRLAYWLGLIVILGLLVAEHILARRRDLRWVNAAFFKLNAVISMLFLAVTVVEVVFPWFRLRWY